MRRASLTRATVSLLAMCILVANAFAQERQTTPERVVVNVDYGPPPRSLELLWRASPLVVRGRVESSKVRVAAPGDIHPDVITDHRVAVLEVFKDEAKAASAGQIHVLQHAGTLNVGGKIIVSDPEGMPVFVSGQELVLFLRPRTKAGGFSIVSGPSGAYATDGDIVRLPSGARRFQEFGQRPEITKEEFFATVRSLSARK
jgi:hypothetical protein